MQNTVSMANDNHQAQTFFMSFLRDNLLSIKLQKFYRLQTRASVLEKFYSLKKIN